MEQLTFSIEEVRHGWFVCRFGEMELWASDSCGHDGPRQFLTLLSQVIGGEREEGFTVFDTEPGTYVLYARSGGQSALALWYTKQNYLDWYPMGVGDRMVLSELPCHLKMDEQLLRMEDLDLYRLAWSAAEEFGKLRRETYIRHWMPFPEAELLELRHCLGDYS